MTAPRDSDDLLHRALSDIGPGLPEPKAPAGARERIAGLGGAGAALAWSASARRRVVGTAALVAATLALLALSGLMFAQNHRLRTELERARAAQAQAPGGASIVPAGRDLPPLVAVRFYHPQCDVARAVAPRFEELERSHPSEEVLFVSLDISESQEAQSAKLACALDCDFVLSCGGEPVRSGMIVLADTRSRQVIQASHDTTDIGELERALDAALLTCGAERNGG